MGDGYGSTNLNSPEKERKTKKDSLNAIAFSVYTLHCKSKVLIFLKQFSVEPLLTDNSISRREVLRELFALGYVPL